MSKTCVQERPAAKKNLYGKVVNNDHSKQHNCYPEKMGQIVDIG